MGIHPPPPGAARYLAIDTQTKRHHVEMYSPTQLHPTSRDNVHIWAAYDLKKCQHESETESEFLSRVLECPTDQCYPSGTSQLPEGLCGEDSPVHTLNENTSDYTKFGIEQLMKELDVPTIIDGFGPSASKDKKDKTRGNYQRHFGVACGKNVGAPETDADILKYSGCTRPRLNRDSKDPSIVRAFDIGWRIGKIIGIDYCQDGFVNNNPWAKPTFDFVEEMLGSPGFASMSLCLLELSQGHRVSRHTDDANDPRLSAVLNITQIVYRDDKWYRVSFIFYMRKSIHDMNKRREACKEMFDKCVKFLNKCEETGEQYRLPPTRETTPEEEVKTYFQDSVGLDGMILTIEKDSSRIVSAALRTKASANKQGTYLASVACAVAALLKCRNMILETEFSEIISVVGHLSNIYEYVTVLSLMQDDWDRKTSLEMHGGLVQYIFKRIIELVGSVSGGSGRRCQTFLNKDFVMRDVRNNCHIIRRSIGSLMQKNNDIESSQTTKQLRQQTEVAIFGLSDKCSNMGPMTAAHVIHPLCLLGLAPKFMLNYAAISPSASQFKTKNLSETMRKYVCDESKSKDDEKPLPKAGKQRSSIKSKKPEKTATKADKLATLLASVTRALQARTGNPNLSEAMAENIQCEAVRGTVAYDLFFGEHAFFREVAQSGSNQKGAPHWVAIYPTLKDDGTLSFTQEETTNVHSSFVNEESGEAINATGSSAIWGPEEEAVLCSKISIGKKRSATEASGFYPYEELVILPHEIGIQPGLLHSIKTAMCRHSPTGGKHSDCMSRLNSLPGLTGIVQRHLDSKAVKQQRSMPAKKKRCVSWNHVLEDPTASTPNTDTVNKGGQGANTTVGETMAASVSRSLVPVVATVVQEEAAVVISPAKGMNRSAVSNPNRSESAPPQVASRWRMGGHREISILKITYRKFATMDQCLGTVLVGGCFGFKSAVHLEGVKSNCPYATYVPPTNIIHSVLSSAAKTTKVPQLVCSQSRKRRKGKKRNSGNYSFESNDVDGQRLYRVCCDLVPDEAMGRDSSGKGEGSCKLQDMIAASLGGTRLNSTVEPGLNFWYFPSRQLATDYLALWVLCAIGDQKYYFKIKQDMLRKHGNQAHDQIAAAVVVKYPMEQVANKKPVAGYFLLAHKVTLGDGPELVIAIPSRDHAKLRAEGPVNKKSLGRGDTTHFFRLL